MSPIDIKRAVKEQVSFSRYHDGNLWYKTNNNEEFPVPVSDIGNATFMNKDKGMLFMRYMRAYNKTLKNTES
jgi:hypothetical protein